MENVDNLIIEHLRAMRSSIDQIAADVREVKHRLTLVEATQGTTLQHIGHLSTSIAQQQVSFDRMTERVERMESRLELQG
jgi:phage shock protein A